MPVTRHSRALSQLLRQYAGFFLVSGTGLLIALSMLWLLVHLGNLPVGWANAIADVSAVTFVFFVSRQKLFFSASSRRIGLKYLAWLAWQAIHILLISLTLAWLTQEYFEQGLCGKIIERGAGHLDSQAIVLPTVGEGLVRQAGISHAT